MLSSTASCSRMLLNSSVLCIYFTHATCYSCLLLEKAVNNHFLFTFPVQNLVVLTSVTLHLNLWFFLRICLPAPGMPLLHLTGRSLCSSLISKIQLSACQVASAAFLVLCHTGGYSWCERMAYNHPLRRFYQQDRC